MDYTAVLREAHLNTLRQKYLDIMEEARLEKEQKQIKYDQSAQNAYVDRMTGMRDKPQQLRAYGFGGGMEESELGDIMMDYQNQIENLKKDREKFISEYNRVIEVQTRAMNNAVAEYNARVALEDAKAAEAAAKTTSKSTSTKRSAFSKSSSGSSSGGVPQVVGGPMVVSDGKLVPAPMGPVYSSTVSSMYGK